MPIAQKIRELKKEEEITLEKKEKLLRESGSFKEKLLNEGRFQDMAEEKAGTSKGKTVEEDSSESGEEEEVPEKNSATLTEAVPRTSASPPMPASESAVSSFFTSSGIPADQVRLPSSDSGSEDNISGGEGGYLMEDIRQSESPRVDLGNFAFGEDLLEDDDSCGRKKQKKTKAKTKQVEVSPLMAPPTVSAPSTVSAPVTLNKCYVGLERCGQADAAHLTAPNKGTHT